MASVSLMLATAFFGNVGVGENTLATALGKLSLDTKAMLKIILLHATILASAIFPQIRNDVHVATLEASTKELVAVSRSSVALDTVLSAFIWIRCSW